MFWTATALIAVDTILFTMVVPALPEYQDRYGFSDAVASLIFAAFPVGMLVTALWAAGLVNRFGRRPVMILAALTLAAATLAFALANGVALITLARFVQGLAAGLVWTAALAAISDVYPQEELGLRMGLAETAGGVVGLAGPPFAGALIATVGLDVTFYIATALPALALIPTLLVPETRRGPAAGARLIPDLRRLWRVRTFRVAGVALATGAAALALVEPLLPLDLSDRLELSSLGVGIVFGIGLAAYLLLVPIAGRWSDRRGRRAPIILGGALMAAGLPFIAVGPVWSVTIAFSVAGAGHGGDDRPDRAADGGGGRRGGHDRPLWPERGGADGDLRHRLRRRPAGRSGRERGPALPGDDSDRLGGDRGDHRLARPGPLRDEARAPGFGPGAKGTGPVALVASPGAPVQRLPGRRLLRRDVRGARPAARDLPAAVLGPEHAAAVDLRGAHGAG